MKLMAKLGSGRAKCRLRPAGAVSARTYPSTAWPNRGFVAVRRPRPITMDAASAVLRPHCALHPASPRYGTPTAISSDHEIFDRRSDLLISSCRHDASSCVTGKLSGRLVAIFARGMQVGQVRGNYRKSASSTAWCYLAYG